MSSNEFDNFIKHQATKTISHNIFERKEGWLNQIDNLYARVLEILDPYIKSGNITTFTKKISIHEELLGSYEVDSLCIDIGSTDLQFRPIGTYLFGSPGRIDLTGKRDSIRFVLAQPNDVRATIRIISGEEAERTTTKPPLHISTFVWKISTTPPNIKYVEITDEALTKAIMQATNG